MHIKENVSGYSDALLCEAEELALPRDAITMAGVYRLRVPEVFSVNERRMEMTEIVPVPPTDALLRKLRAGLACIHNLSQHCFGFYRHNYIGMNLQRNCESNDWGSFSWNTGSAIR